MVNRGRRVIVRALSPLAAITLLGTYGCHGGDFGPHALDGEGGAASCIGTGASLPSGPFEPDEHTLALWHFDGTTRTSAEDSGPNALHASIEGAEPTDGCIGGALSFDGENDFVRVPYADALFPTEQITVEALVRPGSSDGGWIYDVQGTFGLGANAAEGDILASTVLRVDHEMVWASFAEPLSQGQWHHLASCFDGETVRLWVDGEEVASTDSPGQLTRSSEMHPDQCETPSIGSACRADQDFFHGKIDEVRVSDVCRYGGGVPDWTAGSESAEGAAAGATDLAGLSDGGVAVAGYLSGPTTLASTGDSNPIEIGTRQPEGGYVARLGADGSPTWATPLAGGDDWQVRHARVAAASSDGVLATGCFQGNAWFGREGDPGAQPLTADGNFDLYLAKLNEAGHIVWLARSHDAIEARGVDIGATADGGALVAANFKGSVVLGEQADGSTRLTAKGGTDALLARFDAAGSLVWTRQFGSPHFEDLTALAVLPDGTAVATGYFVGSTITLAVGEPEETTLERVGFRDAFVAWIDPSGRLGRVAHLRGHGIINAVAAFPDGSLSLGGSFEHRLTFDAGTPRELTLEPQGLSDGFVTHHLPDGSLAWARTIAGADNEEVIDVAATPRGTTLVSGLFAGEPPTTRLSPGQADERQLQAPCAAAALYAHYAADGRLLWSRWVAASESVRLAASAPTAEGIWLGGNVTGDAYFGPALPALEPIHASHPSLLVSRARW